MSESRVVEQCKHRSNGKAVVSAERSTLRGYKAVLGTQVQRLCGKIMLHSLAGDANHIEVTLQQHCGATLTTRACGLFDKNVIQLIAIAFEPARFGKSAYPVGCTALVSRAARYLRQLLKKMKKALGLSALNDIFHSFSAACAAASFRFNGKRIMRRARSVSA